VGQLLLVLAFYYYLIVIYNIFSILIFIKDPLDLSLNRDTVLAALDADPFLERAVVLPVSIGGTV